MRCFINIAADHSRALSANGIVLLFDCFPSDYFSFHDLQLENLVCFNVFAIKKFIKCHVARKFVKNHNALAATHKSLAAKAEQITKSHPMDYLMNHPFFLIRWIEKNRRKLLLRVVNPKPNDVIADIGCERGHLLSIIYLHCPFVKKLYGIDVSGHALREAKRLAEWEGWSDKSKFILGDACHIKLPDSSVDIAISSNVLEHLPDPQAGFNELVRITKPDGRIILNLPNEKRIISIKKLFFKMGVNKYLGNLKLVTPGHLHYPDKKFVHDLVKSNGKIKRMFLGPKISLLGLYIYAVIEPRKSEKNRKNT